MQKPKVAFKSLILKLEIIQMLDCSHCVPPIMTQCQEEAMLQYMYSAKNLCVVHTSVYKRLTGDT